MYKRILIAVGLLLMLAGLYRILQSFGIQSCKGF